jgi:hypothetical protein
MSQNTAIHKADDAFLCIDSVAAHMMIIKQKENEQYQKQQGFQLHHWQSTLKKDELETQQTILV